LLATQNRNVSPATKEILALLARPLKWALKHGRKNYNRNAFLREVENVEAIRGYIENREAVEETLQIDKDFSQIGDYASVFCVRLEDAKDASFQDLSWIQIVERLDAEMLAGSTHYSIPNATNRKSSDLII